MLQSVYKATNLADIPSLSHFRLFCFLRRADSGVDNDATIETKRETYLSGTIMQ